MKTKVFLAVDTFFHNWHSDERKVWLGIQPYINGSPEDVAHWVKTDNNIFDGSASEFKVATPGEIDEGAIPVPLPSELIVKIELLREDGTTLHEVVLDRQRHALVLDPDRLRQINNFSESKSIDKSVSSMAATAYPKLFATQLRQSLSNTLNRDDIDPISPQELAEQLVLKFEMGQRQKYDDTCFDNLGETFDVPVITKSVGTDEVKISATNTHFLLGQLIALSGDIAFLNQVTSMRLYLDDVICPIDDPLNTTQKIFATISESFDPKDFSQSLTWSNNLAHRINAKVLGDHFSVTKLNPIERFIWRLGAKEINDIDNKRVGNNVKWDTFERLDIREKSDVEKSLLIDNEFDQIVFTPTITVDVKFARYRNTPEVLEVSPDKFPTNSMVVAIHPIASDKVKFDALMAGKKQIWMEAMFFAFSVNSKLKEKSNDAIARDIDYEITPFTMQYVDFPWEKDKVLLAFFNTEKDLATQSVPDDIAFSFNDLVYQNAMMVIPLSGELTLQKMGVVKNSKQQLESDRKDPFGPRWEYWQEGTPPKLPNFDALMCKKLDDKDIDLDQLIVTAFHRDKYDYELAQSARRLEAVVKAKFINIRETDITNPNTFDFNQVILEDKTNHNQLNIFEQRIDYRLTTGGIESRSRLTHRNADSALPSIKEHVEGTSDLLKKDLHYSFMAVMKDSTSAQQHGVDNFMQQQVTEQLGYAQFSARDFYFDVYQNIGDGRKMSFNLEHTYGSSILLNYENDVPNWIDEPILLATDVAFIDPQDSQSSRLFEVTLSESDGIEMVTVHLEKQLLDPNWARSSEANDIPPSERDTRKALTHIQAWQAFAEMYFAHSVELIVECYNFDVHQLSSGHIDNAIQQGLVKTEYHVLEASSALKLLIETVFEDFPNASQGFAVPTGSNWSSGYNAVRFRLDLRRQENMLPAPEAEKWDVHRRKAKLPKGGVEELYSLDGVVTEQLMSDDISAQVGSFLQQLRQKGGYLHPKGLENDKKRNEQYFALLGDGITPSYATPNSNAWLVPTKIRKGEGEIKLAYCPIGIIPVTQDPYLKQNTSETIRRYFEALQSVVDFEQYAWFTGDAKALAKRVFGLSNSNIRELYLSLISAATDKFKALPDPETPPENLVAPVRILAENSQNNSHPIGQGIRKHINELLTLQPTLFSSLKALGLVDVISVNEAPIRSDFYDLFLGKKVDQLNASIQGVMSPDKLIHKDKQRFTFLEQLDDHQYDNGFTFKAFRGETAERLFEQKPAGTSETGFHINTKNNEVYVPLDEPVPIDIAELRLASRRPVQNPTLGSIRQTRILPEQTDKHLSLPELLSGRIVAVDAPYSNTDLEPQRHSVATFSEKLDKVVVSAVYKIKGDEESDSMGINDAFLNDGFYVLISGSKLTVPLPANAAVPLKFNNLVQGLQSVTPLALQSSLVDLVLDPDNLDYCAKVVGRPPVQRKIPDKELVQKAFRIIQTEDKLQVVEISNNTKEQAQYPCSVYLYKNEVHDVLLWLEIEVPLWQAKYVSLMQTRNQADSGDNQQRIFASEFATLSHPIGDALDRMTRYVQQRDVFTRVEIDNGEKTPMEFIRIILGERIEGIDAEFVGKVNLLNVTLKEDSSSSYPSNVPQKKKIDIFNGSFAVKLHQSNESIWASHPIVWFPLKSKVKRWRIDVEWRDPNTNDEILRIEDIPVFLK